MFHLHRLLEDVQFGLKQTNHITYQMEILSMEAHGTHIIVAMISSVQIQDVVDGALVSNWRVI